MNYLQRYIYNYLNDVSNLLLEYVDAEYSLWLTWLLTPLIITFLLPAVLIVLIYTSAVIFHVYKLYRLRLVDGLQGDWRQSARLAVCALWDAHGWLWHGYEISGLENIPEGPCLFIYYHGALPVDMYYFIGRMFLLKRRMVHTVADRFMFKIPGWSIVLDGLCVIPGTVQTCTNLLRAGNKLAISPGGVYEAQFGDHNYQLNWKARIGFAKVAQEAKVPIVPIFTQNVREAFRTVGWLRWVWLRIYQSTRIPLAPIYGGFPVKLLTHVGTPIQHDPTLTPQQLQVKVAHAIEELVEEHQRLPGSILRALIERVYRVPKHPNKPTDKRKSSNGACGNGTLPNAADEENIKQSEKYVNRNVDEVADDKVGIIGDKDEEHNEKIGDINDKIKENDKDEEHDDTGDKNAENGDKSAKNYDNNEEIYVKTGEIESDILTPINEKTAEVYNKITLQLEENTAEIQTINEPKLKKSNENDIEFCKENAAKAIPEMRGDDNVTAVTLTDVDADRTGGDGKIKVS